MIKVENLVKIFGTKKAVAGVSFNVERGEVLGFIGPLMCAKRKALQ